MQVDARITRLSHWLCQVFNCPEVQLTPLLGDAGFRRYFRLEHQTRSYIVVDSPVATSNNQAFIKVQGYLAQQNVQVPAIIACDKEQGFMCLTDFGNTLLAHQLTLENMPSLYQQAIDLLPSIATSELNKQISDFSLPIYDKAFIELELSIFTQWLLEKHLAIFLSEKEHQQLALCFDLLVNNALEQPQVMMHRDFHSRNIMVLTDNSLGIIDFQDAVIGPITYDIVSLLRDCYIKWPQDKISPLFRHYCQTMSQVLSLEPISIAQWQRWFDLMGMQRHLKASGIFCRLWHRDGKNSYLKDIPLTLSYVVDISAQYPELGFIHQLLVNKVLPRLATKTKK